MKPVSCQEGSRTVHVSVLSCRQDQSQLVALGGAQRHLQKDISAARTGCSELLGPIHETANEIGTHCSVNVPSTKRTGSSSALSEGNMTPPAPGCASALTRLLDAPLVLTSCSCRG